jgi:hypothetical protein
MATVNTIPTANLSTVSYIGGGSQYRVVTAAGDHYIFYVDATSLDLFYRKSSDGGLTWGAGVSILAGSVTAFSVWYDRWSNISAGLIHLAYTESVGDETRYRTIDTESSDTLSTETVIFNGGSTAAGGALSITRARGGNVYCKTMIDAGAEGGFYRLPNANVPNGAWDAARTDTEALATTDMWILVPGFAADNQDIMCIFYDTSAAGLSRYVYDDSANSWAESAIIADGSATLPIANTSYPHFAAAVDLTNSQILVVSWNAIDAANQDLLGFTVTESAITAFTTTPVLNATDDCGFASIAIDTDTQDWYVFYAGKSDGSETYATNITINYKKSTDDGATWGAETAVSPSVMNVLSLFAAPRFASRIAVGSYISAANNICYAAFTEEPAAAGGLASNMFGGGVVQ